MAYRILTEAEGPSWNDIVSNRCLTRGRAIYSSYHSGSQFEYFLKTYPSDSDNVLIYKYESYITPTPR